MAEWMIYGANGYTGELIAREAVKRGLEPILAGRNEESLGPIARELKLKWRVFDLTQPTWLQRELNDIELVLHCAGPFLHTSESMVSACLEAGAHYLDITGEIAVFEAIMARDAEAKERGVTLLPGVGFDVVPTDSMAAMLAHRLPSATDLILAFYTPGGEISRGTMKTMIEGLGEGGAIRRDGKIVRVPMAHEVMEIPFSCGKKLAMTIPWGDVSTAFHSTGIPNIRVFHATSRKAATRTHRFRALLPLLALKPVRRILQRIAERRTGPDLRTRSNGRTFLWGRASNPAGEEVTMTMTTPESYAFTTISAVSAVQRVLGAQPPRPGSFTPARFLGPGFITEIPGVVIQ